VIRSLARESLGLLTPRAILLQSVIGKQQKVITGVTMNFPSIVRKRRVAGLAGACALALGSVAGAAIAGGGVANAAACDPATFVASGTTCTITGTAGLSGLLSFAAPATLTWSGSATGVATAYYVDTTALHQIYSVDDETLSGAGWNVNAYATNFTNEKGTADAAIALSTNGSLTLTGGGALQTTTPSATLTCNGGTAGPNCSLPTNTLTYPVTITGHGTTAVPIYNAGLGTGEGAMNIGGSGADNPVGWWITVPPGTAPGIYTTTITMDISSGPGGT